MQLQYVWTQRKGHSAHHRLCCRNIRTHSDWAALKGDWAAQKAALPVA